MMKDFKPDQERADRVVKALKSVSDQSARARRKSRLHGCATARSRSSPSSAPANSRSSKTTWRASNVTLTPEQVKSLDEASTIDLGFPYSMYSKELVRGIAYGGLRDQILA